MELKRVIGEIPGVRRAYGVLRNITWIGTKKTVWEIEGSKMYLNPWEKSPMRRTFRSYIRYQKEPLTTKIVREGLKPGYCVIDIGANIGYFTLLAASIVGKKGTVYAFEPEPTNFHFLCKNIELNDYDMVVPFQKAVSNTSGTVKLYLANERDTGAHTLREHHEMEYFNTKAYGKFVEVEAVKLDEVVSEIKKPVDFIKMDMEGSEANAFAGMKRILGGNRNLKILTEFYPLALREMGNSPEQFAREILVDCGFSCFVVDELRTSEERCFQINSVDELMSLCNEKDKILNLFLERK
jgi:FkbM family methyltransferase